MYRYTHFTVFTSQTERDKRGWVCRETLGTVTKYPRKQLQRSKGLFGLLVPGVTARHSLLCCFGAKAECQVVGVWGRGCPPLSNRDSEQTEGAECP